MEKGIVVRHIDWLHTTIPHLRPATFCAGACACLPADLVVGAGYPLEEHFVTTGDGYVLGLYHIPHGRSDSASGRGSAQQPAASTGRSSQQRRSRMLMDADGASTATTASAASAASSKPCVLLQHGLLDSSAAWVLNEPPQSLGFILADAGYSVWLGNSRGNAFSRNHTGLDPGRAPFWDFSWDDMAAYDMPAVVDYILQRCEWGNCVEQLWGNFASH